MYVQNITLPILMITGSLIVVFVVIVVIVTIWKAIKKNNEVERESILGKEGEQWK